MADALQYLKGIMEDSVVLVTTPTNPLFCPQPRKCKYLTLLPINGNPNVDRGPLHSFAAASLPTASKEGPRCWDSHTSQGPALLWIFQVVQDGDVVGGHPAEGPTVAKHHLRGVQRQGPDYAGTDREAYLSRTDYQVGHLW